MRLRRACLPGLAALLGCTLLSPAHAAYFFSTGNTDGLMAVASKPGSGGSQIESADDFILPSQTTLTSATFTGLLAPGSSVTDVAVAIYGVFPVNSNTARTSGSPFFSTPNVPTRVNSPSDIATATRDSAASGLSFTTSVLQASFTASNSVRPGGIHPTPNQTTGGSGPATGTEVEFDVSFLTPITLSAGQYFFVPQVATNAGDFLWLSAPRPISGGSGPFSPDLQSWTRDGTTDPDWLRIGTDIVGGAPAPTFNAAFSLSGTEVPDPVPEPATLTVLALGTAALGWLRRRRGPAERHA